MTGAGGPACFTYRNHSALAGGLVRCSPRLVLGCPPGPPVGVLAHEIGDDELEESRDIRSWNHSSLERNSAINAAWVLMTAGAERSRPLVLSRSGARTPFPRSTQPARGIRGEYYINSVHCGARLLAKFVPWRHIARAPLTIWHLDIMHNNPESSCRGVLLHDN